MNKLFGGKKEEEERIIRTRKTTYASVCGAVAQRSRDSGRRSRDRHATVKQRFLDVSSDLEIFFTERSKVTERSRDSSRRSVTRPSADCQTTFFGRFKQFENATVVFEKVTIWNGHCDDSGRRSRDRRPTVKQRFLYVSSNLKFFEKSH